MMLNLETAQAGTSGILVTPYDGSGEVCDAMVHGGPHPASINFSVPLRSACPPSAVFCGQSHTRTCHDASLPGNLQQGR